MLDTDARRRDLGRLADEAEQLQTQVNEFIGRATIVRVDLPAALYEANAELLVVSSKLRELAERSVEDQAFRHGGRQAHQGVAADGD